MDAHVEAVVDAPALLGEGPVWDEREGIVWWLDIPGQSLHRFDPATGDDQSQDLGQEVGTLALRQSGGLVLATPDGFVAYDWSTGRGDLLAAVEADNPATRMNDGKCDRQGRFWAGTMAYDFTPGAAAFYCMDADHNVAKQFGDVTISNGLAWSADDSTLYYIDTGTGSVEAFDFDGATGTLASRRTVVKISESDGLPDGMCIDTEGYLWVALFNGGAVHRYSPAGVLDGVLEIPAAKVTCCAFAGEDLGDMYITTASLDTDATVDPGAGKLYRCRPGVIGTPVTTYAG
jgi:sugar lactone lactonase YvrE